MELYKKVILAVLLIIFTITLVACFNGDRYNGENFSFIYPDGWELSSERVSDDIEEVTLLPEDDEGEIIFTAEIDFADIDLEQEEYSYSEEDFIEETTEEFANFKEMEDFIATFEVLETEKIEVDGQPAFQIVFAEEDIIYNNIIIYKANQKSVLNYIAKDDVYEDEVIMLEQILDSFEFEF